MIPLILSMILISMLLCISLGGRTKSKILEELIVAIDAAGALQGDDMDQNPDPQLFSPAWAHGVETLHVLALGNGDQLGASNVTATLAGSAFPDGPHQIPMGGHGGENADLANEGSRPTPLVDLGIKVNPSSSYTVTFQSTGDAQDEFGCSCEIMWQAEEVRQRKQWVSRNVTTAVVDTEVPSVTLAGAALPNIPPGGSTMIGGVIGSCAGDLAALGVNHLITKARGGLKDDQEILLGGVGGELIIGSGAHIEPTQRVGIEWPIEPNEAIYVEFMSTIEAGVMDGLVSFGFVKGDGGE